MERERLFSDLRHKMHLPTELVISEGETFDIVIPGLIMNKEGKVSNIIESFEKKEEALSFIKEYEQYLIDRPNTDDRLVYFLLASHINPKDLNIVEIKNENTKCHLYVVAKNPLRMDMYTLINFYETRRECEDLIKAYRKKFTRMKNTEERWKEDYYKLIEKYEPETLKMGKAGIGFGGDKVENADSIKKRVYPVFCESGWAVRINTYSWPHYDADLANELSISSTELNKILEKFGGTGHGYWIKTKEQCKKCCDYITRNILNKKTETA